jgi:hypothetical protein
MSTAADFVLMSDEDRRWAVLGLMVRLRAMGCSGRVLAKGFGFSKSTFARVWMPALDSLVSHLGQDGWDSVSKIKDAVASDAVALSHLGQKDRSPRPPRDSEAARLMVALASLGQLINRDPNDIVADMEPEMRDDAIRLAAMLAPWLAQLKTVA